MISTRPAIGDRLASYDSRSNFYEIVKVDKVTPSGQITAGGRRYIADGREITSHNANRELMPVTPWIEDRVKVQRLAGEAHAALTDAFRALNGARSGDRQALECLTADKLEALISSARAICPKSKP